MTKKKQPEIQDLDWPPPAPVDNFHEYEEDEDGGQVAKVTLDEYDFSALVLGETTSHGMRFGFNGHLVVDIRLRGPSLQRMKELIAMAERGEKFERPDWTALHMAKATLKKQLMGKPGINGIGIGHNKVRVNVLSEEYVDTVPKEVDGFPTEVVVVGIITAGLPKVEKKRCPECNEGVLVPDGGGLLYCDLVCGHTEKDPGF